MVKKENQVAIGLMSGVPAVRPAGWKLWTAGILFPPKSPELLAFSGFSLHLRRIADNEIRLAKLRYNSSNFGPFPDLPPLPDIGVDYKILPIIYNDLKGHTRVPNGPVWTGALPQRPA